MPDTSSIESAPANGPESESETDPENGSETTSSASEPETSPKKRADKPVAAKRPSRWSRWIAVAALVVAVIAAGGAGAAWWRLIHDSSPKYSEQETAKAKKSVCSAYATVQRAVVVNTHVTSPPNDPAGKLGVEANARLALLGGGAFLRDRLASEPAAPADLSKLLTSTAGEIEQLGINFMAGASGESQDALKHDLDEKVGRIKELCT